MEGGALDISRPRRMLSEKQVLEIIPVGRTTLYRMEKAGKFPRSTYISAEPADLVRRRNRQLGRTRSTNSIRAADAAKGGVVGRSDAKPAIPYLRSMPAITAISELCRTA